MGDTICNYGAERFGMRAKKQRKQRGPSVQTKSSRQQEIKRLVKERRQLSK